MAPAALLLAVLAAQAPPADLPEGNAFVRGLVGAQKRNEDALNRYTYDLLDVREDLDDKGGESPPEKGEAPKEQERPQEKEQELAPAKPAGTAE